MVLDRSPLRIRPPYLGSLNIIINMAKTKTYPWDLVKYLTTTEDRALYVQAVIDESDGDPSLIVAAFGDMA